MSRCCFDSNPPGDGNTTEIYHLILKVYTRLTSVNHFGCFYCIVLCGGGRMECRIFVVFLFSKNGLCRDQSKFMLNSLNSMF